MRIRFEVGKMRIGSEDGKWIYKNWMLKYPPERNFHAVGPKLRIRSAVLYGVITVNATII
jgi:hypothetical protein